MPLRKELREEWARAGYSRYMGSAEVCAPPAYAFRRVYHMMPAEYALSAIALRRLKIARVADTNDRFEFLALLIRDKNQRKVMQTEKIKFNEDTGLLCFTKNWTSPVLWSHYANRHRGICLGLNLRRASGEEVKYEDARLQKGIEHLKQGEPLPEELSRLLACTKSGHWGYEEEIRMFVRLKGSIKEGDLYFRLFDDDLELSEVILGENCHLDVEEVRKFARALHPQAVTFKARLAFQTFDVVPNVKHLP